MIGLLMPLICESNSDPTAKIGDTATTTGGGVTTVSIARLLGKPHVKEYVVTFQKRASKAIQDRENAVELRENAAGKPR